MIVRKITFTTKSSKHVYHVFPDGSYVSDNTVFTYHNPLHSKGYGDRFDERVDLDSDDIDSLEISINHLPLDHMFFNNKTYPGLMGDCEKYFLERTKTLVNYKKYDISSFFGLSKLDVKGKDWLYQIGTAYHLDLHGDLRRAHVKMYSDKKHLIEKAKSFKGDGILLYGFRGNRNIKKIIEVKGGCIEGESVEKYITEHIHDMYIGSLENK